MKGAGRPVFPFSWSGGDKGATVRGRRENTVWCRTYTQNPPRGNIKMYARTLERRSEDDREDETTGEDPSHSHRPHLRGAGRPLFPFRWAGGDKGATVRWRREDTVWCRTYTQNPPRGNTKMYSRRAESRGVRTTGRPRRQERTPATATGHT